MRNVFPEEKNKTKKKIVYELKTQCDSRTLIKETRDTKQKNNIEKKEA